MVIRGRLSRKSSKPTVISISKVFYCFFLYSDNTTRTRKVPFLLRLSSLLCTQLVHSRGSPHSTNGARTLKEGGRGRGLWYPPLTHTHTHTGASKLNERPPSPTQRRSICTPLGGGVILSLLDGGFKKTPF